MGPWWAWAAKAVDLLAKGQANRAADKQRQSLESAMRQYGLARAGEQEAATRNYISTITPEQRAAQLQQAQGEVRGSLEQSVDAAIKAQPAFDVGGRQSEDYTSRRDANMRDTSEKIRRAIEQLSIGGSTERLATADDLRLRRAAGELAAASQANRNVGDAYMEAIRTVRPDPALTAIGDLAGAFSTFGFGGGQLPGGGPKIGLGTVPGQGIGGQGVAGLGLKLPRQTSVGLRGLSL